VVLKNLISNAVTFTEQVVLSVRPSIMLRERGMQDPRRPPVLLWSIYCLLPAILLLDLRAPLGVAVGILYIVPLFATHWLTGRWRLLTVATVSSVFTLVASFFSPPAAPLWVDLTNRLLIITTLWTMVLLMEWRRQAEEARQRLSRQLLAVQENERRHLARELHDEVMQTLTALKLSLGVVAQASPTATRELDESVETVDDLVEQIRTVSLDLRPAMLDDLGLVATLQWYCERQARRLALPITFVAAPFPTRPSRESETACFRVVQEALTNVAKHAHAKRVWVNLQQQEGALHLTVRDNGVGFDVAAARARVAHGSGLGLRGMEERLWVLGGHLDIASTPRHGTEIHARVPMTGADTKYTPVSTTTDGNGELQDTP
jgi:signal transduction histidine kinase